METNAQARQRLLEEFRARGWSVRLPVKFPIAEHDEKSYALRFRARAVHVVVRGGWKGEVARAVVEDMRGQSVESLVSTAEPIAEEIAADLARPKPEADGVNRVECGACLRVMPIEEAYFAKEGEHPFPQLGGGAYFCTDVGARCEGRFAPESARRR